MITKLSFFLGILLMLLASNANALCFQCNYEYYVPVNVCNDGCYQPCGYSNCGYVETEYYRSPRHHHYVKHGGYGELQEYEWVGDP